MQFQWWKWARVGYCFIYTIHAHTSFLNSPTMVWFQQRSIWLGFEPRNTGDVSKQHRENSATQSVNWRCFRTSMCHQPPDLESWLMSHNFTIEFYWNMLFLLEFQVHVAAQGWVFWGDSSRWLGVWTNKHNRGYYPTVLNGIWTCFFSQSHEYSSWRGGALHFQQIYIHPKE